MRQGKRIKGMIMGGMAARVHIATEEEYQAHLAKQAAKREKDIEIMTQSEDPEKIMYLVDVYDSFWSGTDYEKICIAARGRLDQLEGEQTE